MAKPIRFGNIYILLTVCAIFGFFYHISHLKEDQFTKKLFAENISDLHDKVGSHLNEAFNIKKSNKNGVQKPVSNCKGYRENVRRSINQARYCRTHQTDNILCASTREITQFERPKYIEGLRSPCVTVKRDSRYMFYINEEFSENKPLNVSTIEILKVN